MDSVFYDDFILTCSFFVKFATLQKAKKEQADSKTDKKRHYTKGGRKNGLKLLNLMGVKYTPAFQNGTCDLLNNSSVMADELVYCFLHYKRS